MEDFMDTIIACCKLFADLVGSLDFTFSGGGSRRWWV